jgi:hypothetical protein
MAQQEASRIAQMNDKFDEYNLNYQKAVSMRNYAQQAFDADRSDDPAVKATLQRNLDEANATVAYWGKKLGKDTEPTVSKQEVKEEEPKEVITQEDQKQIAEAATSENEWTDAALKKAEEEANKIKDPGDRAKALQDIKKKGKTKEEITREINKAIDEAVKNKDPSRLPAGYAKRSFDGVPHVVKKDSKGNWVKVRKW